MSPTVFHFDNYVVRPVGERDRQYMAEIIENDEYHAETMTPDYFLDLKPGEDAWALEDEHGKVLFYFKTQTAVRLSMLFAEQREKTKNRIALLKGLAWIEAQLRQNCFREILFDTDGTDLAQMAKKRMGFRESRGDLTRLIGLPRPPQARMGDWDAVPQVSQEGGG
jgi:hypothetical protein